MKSTVFHRSTDNITVEFITHCVFINMFVCLFVDHSYENSGLFLPSSMSNFLWSLDFRNKTRPRMLRRAVFTDQQRKGLELAFLKQKYISKPERKKLAQHLNLKDSQVKIW